MKKILTVVFTFLLLLSSVKVVFAKTGGFWKATFWGRIKSINGNTFVLTTIFRGDQTVKVDAGTKIVNRREEAILFADLQAGHWVRVSGLWDSTLKTIEEVKTIKDWSLHSRLVLTPTPTQI